ncbi:MAG: UDP-N-acetylglucosamine 2-epimerase (non-hydrolyzing) [Candidatus Obscuribacterales bacterium]|nr:UDP-N-acetylglucosamine 2-epimerase (non-hydrolyzing) [Candidatus Obscuribacterales bacterium]
MKKKVMCVFGTRSESIKLAPVIQALKKSLYLTPIVVVTGYHREILDQMIGCLQIEVDLDLNLTRPRLSLAEHTALMISGLEEAFNKFSPDLVLVQGDTIMVMTAALVAHYHKVPVAHVEAGLRTADRYNPFAEEMYRRLASQLSTLHFAPTQQAVENLRRESIEKHVYLTGNTVIDSLIDALEQLQTSQIDQKKLFGAADFTKYRVLLASVHRRENRSAMGEIAAALKQIVDQFPDTQILYPMHKNPVIHDLIETTLKNHPRIILIEPVDYVSFVWAMQHCFFILTDSGGIQEEAPMLGKPVLVLRTNTEREEGTKSGALQIVGTKREDIFQAAHNLLSDRGAYDLRARSVTPFGDGQASHQVVNIIEKYFAMM